MLIYKIGLDRYNNIDKNGGLCEYELIQFALKDIQQYHNDTIIVVNGAFVEREEEFLLKILPRYKNRIFIATDIVAFDSNKAIIEACTHLLHQSPYRKIDAFPNIKQFYSYVPELFYNVGRIRSLSYARQRDNLLVFGGGVRDNEETINKYLSAVPSVSFTKTDSKDTRIDYSQYLNELRKHNYNLLITRGSYVQLGWVTPRYYETLACGCMPIIDTKYDVDGYFTMSRCTPGEVADVIRFYNTHPVERKIVIQHYKNLAKTNANAFSWLIKTIV